MKTEEPHADRSRSENGFERSLPLAAGPSAFIPPTAEQVGAHLDRYPPRGPSRLGAWMTLGVVVLLVMTLLTNQSPLTLLLWLLLAAMIINAAMRIRRARRLEQQVTWAQELAVLRRHAQSLRLAWRTLPSSASAPMQHGRTVACIASNLDQLKAYDAAIVAYDYLIDWLPAGHRGAVQLQVHRAIAQLETGQLIDADDALHRLRGLIESFRHTAIGATYRLAGLIQQIRTNHYAEAAEGCGDLIADLRPLGVEAGYGHALMALSYHMLAHRPEPPVPGRRDSHQAELWWARATLLLPLAALTDRFPELSVIDLPPQSPPYTQSADPWTPPLPAEPTR